MKLNKITAALSGGVLLWAGATSVQAAVISFEDNYIDVLTELADEQLRVSLFDSSWGTLTGVSVSLSTSIDSEGTVTNNGAGPADFTVQTLVQSYTGTGVNLPTPLIDLLALPNFTTINSQTYTALASGAADTFGPGGAASGVIDLFTGYNASFIGTGNFGFDFNTLILSTFSGGGGNIAADVQTYTDGTLRVEYTYDPTITVPEPGSLLLMGLGLVGLAGIGRRKLKA